MKGGNSSKVENKLFHTLTVLFCTVLVLIPLYWLAATRLCRTVIIPAESPVRPIDNWQDSQPSSSIEPVNGISFGLIRCLVHGPDQESGWRLVIGDIDAVKIWTVSNVISQSENYFPIVFIHLCHSARHIIGTCINNISMFYTATVKCIAGLWEHVQWTLLVREKLFWSVI